MSHFDIHVHTQYMENYADEGAPPYWKFKGGQTFVITGFEHPLSAGIGAAAAAAVEALRGQIEHDTDYSRSYLLDWEFAPVGSLTEDEKLQQEYDGRVSYPSPRLAAAG